MEVPQNLRMSDLLETGIKELTLLVLDVVTGIAIIIGDRKGGAIELQSQLILRVLHRMVIFYH